MSDAITQNIHTLLTPSRVRVGLPGSTKAELLHEMVDLIERHPAIRDAEALRAAIFAREAIMSTGVGKGVGLPHAKTDAVEGTLAAFAITAEPVPFGAIDDEPVRLLFMLVGTEAAKSEHIKILSRVSRLLNRADFRDRLKAAKTVGEVLAAFEETELQLASG